MGTSWEKIESSAMTYIKNDVSLDYDMKHNAPVFFNRMRAYMEEAIPRVNKPPQLVEKLKKTTEPEYDDVIIESDIEQAGQFTLASGLKNFDICSVGVITEDKFGTPHYTPVRIERYDAETGEVSVSGAFPAGTEFTICAYRGANFEDELDMMERSLIANAIYVVYETRFDNNVLERTVKIKDRTFNTGSEAAPMDSNTRRKIEVINNFNDRLRQYAQQIAAAPYQNYNR